MACMNIKREVELEFTVEVGEDCVEFVVYDSSTDSAYVLFRVYDDGRSEVLTNELEDAGLDPDVEVN